ncbi:hypothetical protein [Pseudomonas sp. nanlin1]|uniref:hypothetical protein n=1 Tax=Pseudomonas sp. nanlin1 TaxID=3040605 RepID=UPI00388E1935
MSFAGTGVVAIWHDVVPEARDEFYEWHNREHMPERLGIPGFQRGRRYIALDAGPVYFNLYEADSVQVLGGEDYLARLNAPTTWTQKVVQSYRNVARSICDVHYSAGVGHGAYLVTLRFDVAGERSEQVLQALRDQVLPPLVDAQGITGVHFGTADHAVSKVETAEKKARSEGTEIPSWVIMIEGCAADYVTHVRERLVAELGTLLDTPAQSLSTTLYQLEYTRCKTSASAG